MPRVQLPAVTPKRRAWNKGRLVGQKRPLLPKQVWAIRARLELAGNLRDLALFNVAIDSKLRGCDLVALKIDDLIRDDRVRERVSVVQSKTNKPVQFELAENTRETVSRWIRSPEMIGCQFLFPSRFHDRLHISTRQYGRLVRDWVVSIGLEPSGYGTHSMRRTKVAENLAAMGDAALTRVGKRRQVVMTVPVFSGVCRAVSESDLIALVPAQLAEKVAKTFGLHVFKPPMEIEPALIIGIWHKRSDNAPMSAWMRSQVFELMKGLDLDS